MTWVDQVREALRRLGGIADIADIYTEVGAIRGAALDYEGRAGVRRSLYLNSSSSRAWRRKYDFFFAVGKVREGVWGLRELGAAEPKANDINVPKGRNAPKRSKFEVYRIVRDTGVSKSLKKLHANRCQRCNHSIELDGQKTYSEAHHLRPLGRPHDGPDIPENIVVVCPNCHALLDFFAVRIDLARLRIHRHHKIDDRYVAYHNRQHELVASRAGPALVKDSEALN